MSFYTVSPVEVTKLEFFNYVENVFETAPSQKLPPLVVAGSASENLTLRFNALEEGIASGKLNIYYENAPSALEVVLFGNVVDTAAGVFLKINEHEANTGENIQIPVVLKIENDEIEFVSESDSISFTLSYNATLLDPLKQPRGIIENGLRIINYDLPMQVSQDSILTELFFRSALGNDSLTSLELSNVSTNTDRKVNSSGGSFKLLDICLEGGSRLVRSRLEDAGITGIIPNPASLEAEIKLNIIEKGTKKLYLRNSIGQLVREVDISHLKPGNHNYNMDLSGLSAGVYLLQLSTPGLMQSKKLIVK